MIKFWLSCCDGTLWLLVRVAEVGYAIHLHASPVFFSSQSIYMQINKAERQRENKRIEERNHHTQSEIFSTYLQAENF